VDGTAATPIAQLAASEATEFVADATEQELARVRAGQPVRGTLIGGATFVGTVLAPANALDPSTGLGTVRIGMADGSASVTLGAFGRVDVTVARRDGVPLLPIAALRGAVADGAEVAICQGDHAVLRKLVVGWRDESRFEPVRGLAPGDRVAIDHVLGLLDGTPIVEAK
jgi:HlyD family secretion protein